MQDVHIPAEFLQDPWEKNVSGLGLGRDAVRTPMQWDATPHAGFSNGAPWLPIANNFRLCNVEIQRSDPHSLLTLYRTLLHLRRREPALARGTYKPFDVGPGIVAYERRFGERCIMVALNLTSDPVSLNSSDMSQRCVVLLSTHLDRETGVPMPDCRLRSNEGLILLNIREPGK
jgi:alpha-glucosidase